MNELFTINVVVERCGKRLNCSNHLTFLYLVIR